MVCIDIFITCTNLVLLIVLGLSRLPPLFFLPVVLRFFLFFVDCVIVYGVVVEISWSALFVLLFFCFCFYICIYIASFCRRIVL